MYVANTHLKPVIGIDIHFVNTPIPFIPLPHPYIGLIIDPFDYIPFIGATVSVNNVPRGNTDTGGMIITFIHIPFGVGFSLVPMIGHDSQNFFGSKTVQIDGAPMSGAGYILMTCNDIGIPLSFSPGKKFKPIPSLYLPTSFCIPLQWGKPVVVGGPMVPHFSLMALLKAFAFGSFLKIFGKLGSKLLKALNHKVLKKSPATKKLSALFCKMGFEPVDLITGRVNYEYTDFELPGPIPLIWTRTWDSDAAIKGPLGHGVQLSYDRCVQLWPEEAALSVTMADGRLAVFPLLYHGESYYHPQEKMLLRRKQNGHFILEDYNESLYYHFNHDIEPGIWRLSLIENYSGNRIQLHYTGGHLSAITDSAGRQLLFKLDKQHRITEVKVKHRKLEQILVSYDYNDAGDLVRIADALNQVVEIEYRYHLMRKKTDRNGQSFYWEYDSKKRCIHTWGDGGILEGYIQYSKGYNTVTNSLGEVTTYYFDENNLCVQETDHYGNHRYTQYTGNAEIYREIDEEGNVTGFTYDERGRLTARIKPDGSQVKFLYNDHNQLTLAVFEDGSSKTFGYDERRRLRFINFPNGKVISYKYNKAEQLEAVIESGNGTTALSYDDDKNIASMQMPDGSMMHWKHDALGRCIQTINATGENRFIEYDPLSRIRNLYLPDGNKVSLEYNAYEDVIQATDRYGSVHFEYTALGKLKSKRQNNNERKYLYDTEDRLQTIINETGRRYRFEYNKRGELIGETGFDGLQVKYELDAAGRIIKMLRPGGRYTLYEHDVNGEVVRVEYHDGSWETFSYDKMGRIVEAINENCTVLFARNKLGQVETEQQDEYKVHSRFDKAGFRSQITSNLGADIRLQRNEMSLVTNMKADVVSFTSAKGPIAMAWQAQMKYNGEGQETERILPGGLMSEWIYDQAGRLNEHKVSVRGRAQGWKKYDWDANDRLTGIFDALSHAGTSFKHDVLGNLVFAQYADNSIVHRAADDAGHIYETSDKTDRKYNGAGGLTESKRYIYKYDVEGNLVSKTEKATNKKTRYEWFANGRLKKVKRPDGKTVEFTYDALGRRISKSFAGKITRWVWNAYAPLHEWTYDEKEKPQAVVNEWGDVIFGNDEPNPHTIESITWLFDDDSFVPVAKIENGKTFSIVSDHAGTPQYMFDENGKKVWEGALDIYGRLRTLQGSKNALPFRYQGQYEDAETGLYYNRYRYYAPEEGLYISQDPIGLGGGLRVYGYVGDPNTWVDPLGLHMNGASATVAVKGGDSGLFHSTGKDGAHAEMNGLNSHLNGDGFEGKDVVIKDIVGHHNPGGTHPAPMCVPCRHNIFGPLMDGEARSVTIEVNSGRKKKGDLWIPAKNFKKAQKEMRAILKKFEGSKAYGPRSRQAWAALFKLGKFTPCK